MSYESQKIDIPCQGDLPCYTSKGSAGADLTAYLNQNIVLAPQQRVLVGTNFYLALPCGYEAQVRSRSGLSYKHGITVLNSPGTIDSDYRGEVKVLLINLSNENFTITHGMRIAQLVIAPVVQARFNLVQSLDETRRGNQGFGSSGL